MKIRSDPSILVFFLASIIAFISNPFGAVDAFLFQPSSSPKRNYVDKNSKSVLSSKDAPFEGASPTHPWRALSRHVIPVSTAVIIGSFSVKEIAETSREVINVRNWRRAHGIALLALVRLGRSFAIFQTQAEEIEEVVGEEISETNQDKKNPKNVIASINFAIARAITSPITGMVASFWQR
jgi:hypothetical protein